MTVSSAHTPKENHILAALPAEVIDAQKVRRVEVDAMWTAFADHLVNYVLPSRHITHKNEPLS